jgi:hypothetical protein
VEKCWSTTSIITPVFHPSNAPFSAARHKAPRLGFEPRHSPPKGDVLPLHHLGISACRLSSPLSGCQPDDLCGRDVSPKRPLILCRAAIFAAIGRNRRPGMAALQWLADGSASRPYRTPSHYCIKAPCAVVGIQSSGTASARLAQGLRQAEYLRCYFSRRNFPLSSAAFCSKSAERKK